MHCMYCGMYAKNHFSYQNDIKLDSEKIKPIALVIIELHWSAGISLLVI